LLDYNLILFKQISELPVLRFQLLEFLLHEVLIVVLRISVGMCLLTLLLFRLDRD